MKNSTNIKLRVICRTFSECLRIIVRSRYVYQIPTILEDCKSLPFLNVPICLKLPFLYMHFIFKPYITEKELKLNFWRFRWSDVKGSKPIKSKLNDLSYMWIVNRKNNEKKYRVIWAWSWEYTEMSILVSGTDIKKLKNKILEWWFLE